MEVRMPYEFKYQDADTEILDKQANEYKEKYLSNSGGGATGTRAWQAYVQDGTHTFRFYPDRDAKGYARLIRRAWVHRGLPIGPKKKVWVYGDERVDALMNEIEQEKMTTIFGKKTWQWKSAEVGVACAHVFESSDKEWTIAGHTMVLLLQKRQIFAFQEFVADLHPEDKRKMFDPSLDAVGINFKVNHAASKSNVSVGIAGTRLLHLAMPPQLVADDRETLIPFEGLDKVYITEDQKLSDEDFLEFKKAVYTELEKFKAQGGQATDVTGGGGNGGNNVTSFKDTGPAAGPQSPTPQPTQPTPSNPEPNPKPSPPLNPTPKPQDPEPPPAAAIVPNDERCGLAARIKAKPEQAEIYGHGITFGNRPDKRNPYCTICDYEKDCIELTLSNREAAKVAAQ
jgi:hypothetical protein